MNDSEELAAKFLAYKGFQRIIYEPDGKVPPDFLVDDHIAVEVRRLNQNVSLNNGKYEGLENEQNSLWNQVKKLIFSMSLSSQHESWFVCINFRRPVTPWRRLKSEVKAKLDSFRNNPNRSNCTLVIDSSFQVDLLKAEKVHDTFFVMGGYADSDSGGWILSEVKQNLELCIDEKTQKIKTVRPRYKEWWLVLSDHIGYGLDEFDRKSLRELVSLEYVWDKVILIDPRDHTRWFEI